MDSCWELATSKCKGYDYQWSVLVKPKCGKAKHLNQMHKVQLFIIDITNSVGYIGVAVLLLRSDLQRSTP